MIEFIDAKRELIQKNIAAFRMEMGRWRDPYSLTKDEALYLVAKHTGSWWQFRWKDIGCSKCPSTAILQASHQNSMPKSKLKEFLDIFKREPHWYCLAHTNFWTRDISVHDRDWVIPNYNADLHILLHEIAHAIGDVYEGHTTAWENRFLSLCERYNFIPERKHYTDSGEVRSFY